MKILYYSNGSILATGDISQINDAPLTYLVRDDSSDISEYSLTGFGDTVHLEELATALPDNFAKYNYNYVNNEFIVKS